MHLKNIIPRIIQRPVDNLLFDTAIKQGFDPVIARIIAARKAPHSGLSGLLLPALRLLDSPNNMADIAPSVERLVLAIKQKEVIGIETDHDCDGQTAHAVLYTALVDYFGHPKDKIRSYIGHRLQEGYGLSELLANRILADSPRPTLLITADNGSSDEPRIAMLKAVGIDVIVTDHHEIPQAGVPLSAYSVLNPTREDCVYPDRLIAGCMVAWLLMAAVRTTLMKQNYLPSTSPHLSGLLDFVAVGTVADCVSMAQSHNNRAVVNYGIDKITQGRRPCWRAILATHEGPLTAEDLGFKIGPLLNSDGRLATALGSVSFLLSETDEEAREWIKTLTAQNQERKLIQKNITDKAELLAHEQTAGGAQSLCLLIEAGHAGVHGISASRIKDMFGRPVIIFCPKQGEPGILTGSARSIDGVHLREALQTVANQHPEIIKAFGGHKGAAGVTIYREYFKVFVDSFEISIRAQIRETGVQLGPVIYTDGVLPIEKLNLAFVQEYQKVLAPFGREFEAPVFETEADILSVRSMGESGLHARVSLKIEASAVSAVWFNARKSADSSFPLQAGKTVSLIFSPRINYYRGEKNLQLQIIALNSEPAGQYNNTNNIKKNHSKNIAVRI